MHFRDAHELGDKRLEMEYDLCAHLDPMLIERRPLYDIWFQRIIDQWYQLECEGLDDRRGRNAVCEEVVELSTDLQNSGRSVFVIDRFRDFRDEHFPVRWRNWC